MSYWDDSHWIDYYDAQIHNVFAGGGNAWIEFSYVGLWYVGWRQIVADSADDISRVLLIATGAKQAGYKVMLRVTNAGQITAMQTR